MVYRKAEGIKSEGGEWTPLPNGDYTIQIDKVEFTPAKSAEKYPQIRVTGIGPTTDGGMQELAVKVEMLGRVIDLDVPTNVTIEGDELRATGEFELNHADLGMEPFSVMAGALQVGEKLSFTYDIRARRAAR